MGALDLSCLTRRDGDTFTIAWISTWASDRTPCPPLAGKGRAQGPAFEASGSSRERLSLGDWGTEGLKAEEEICERETAVHSAWGLLGTGPGLVCPATLGLQITDCRRVKAQWVVAGGEGLAAGS